MPEPKVTLKWSKLQPLDDLIASPDANVPGMYCIIREFRGVKTVNYIGETTNGIAGKHGRLQDYKTKHSSKKKGAKYVSYVHLLTSDVPYEDFEEGLLAIESILILHLDPEINIRQTSSFNFTKNLTVINVTPPHSSFAKTMTAAEAHMIAAKKKQDKKKKGGKKEITASEYFLGI